MTNTEAALPFSRREGFRSRLGLIFAMTALADWLFFTGDAPGLSAAIFALACAGLILATNPIRAGGSLRWRIAGLILAALLALVEDVSWLSLATATATLLFTALTLTLGDPGDWPRHLLRMAGLPFIGPVWLLGDLYDGRQTPPKGTAVRSRAALAAWILPVGLFLLFLALFAAANPVIGEWLSQFALRFVPDHLSLSRILFWLAVISLLWPLAQLTRIKTRISASSSASLSKKPA